MNINLANAPASYDASDQARLRTAIVQAFAKVMGIGLPVDALYVRDSTGVIWKGTMSSAGAFTWAAI